MKYTAFGKEARKAMIDLDMSMSVLANELGITRPYLTEIFSGTRKAMKQKERIVERLGLEIVRPASWR